MKNILKQFAEWVIPSNQSEYKRATISLTVYYTLSIILVLVIFNLLIYSLFNTNFNKSKEEYIEHSLLEEYEETYNEEWAEKIQASFVDILITSDLIIILLTLVVAYVLAKRTLTPLEMSYKRQVRFTADAAHELRTPLAVMQAGGEVLLRTDRSVYEYKNYLQEFLEEVKRLTNLSNNLLLLSRTNIQQKSLKEKISLSEICIKQVRIMRSYAETKGIMLEDSIENNLYVIGNGDDLFRLVLNLVKNAIDYNKSEGLVKVSLSKISNQVVLSISDTGIGIKREDKTHIFDRFYKADSSRTLNTESTGLGLAIVKEIVQDHHGNIKVESELGKGSVFTVSLQCL